MTKNKAPPQQASMFETFAQAEAERRTSHLPGRLEAAASYLLGLFQRLDAAMLECDGESAGRLQQEAEELAVKLNGGTRFAMCVDDGGAASLERATREPDGQVPLWGQQGVFDIEVRCESGEACAVRVDFEGIYGTCFSGFSANAVDWDKPFISETGYRSFLGHSHALAGGVSVQDYARRTIEAHIAGELKGKLLPVRPEYRERHGEPKAGPQP
jgi:hypothetical protein